MSSVVSVKFAASTSGYPDADTVRLATAITSGPFQYVGVDGMGAPLVKGQTLFVSALAYDINGTESLLARCAVTNPLPAGATSPLIPIVGDKLWAHLELGTGFYTDAGVTPAVSNGDAIYQWNDTSGNERHATQPVAGRRPTLDTGVTHLGEPTVRFQSANITHFVLPDMSALTEAEIFTVVKLDDDPQTGGDGGFDWFGPSGVSATHVTYTDGLIYDSFGTTVRKTVGNPATDLSAAFHVYHRRSKASDWACYLDNADDASLSTTDVNGDPCMFSTNTNTVAFNSTPQIGATELTGAKINGRIAAVAICSPALTSSERAAVVAALTT